MKLAQLSDKNLLEKTKQVAGEEKLKTWELLLHLQEVDRRLVYAPLGYSSLFSYLVQELGYSEAESTLRVNAMRLMKKIPEVKEKLQSGQLSLSTAAQINSHLKQEGIAPTLEQIKLIIEECAGKSSRHVGKILEKKKQRPNEELSLKLKGKVLQQFLQLQNELGCESPLEVIAALVEEKLKRIKLGESKLAAEAEAEVEVDVTASANLGPNATTPASVKHDSTGNLAKNCYGKNISVKTLRQLHLRSGYRCEYVQGPNGKRCSARSGLQVEHSRPRAWEGAHDLSNLKHYCQTHNLRAGVDRFGAGKMRRG